MFRYPSMSEMVLLLDFFPLSSYLNSIGPCACPPCLITTPEEDKHAAPTSVQPRAHNHPSTPPLVPPNVRTTNPEEDKHEAPHPLNPAPCPYECPNHQP